MTAHLLKVFLLCCILGLPIIGKAEEVILPPPPGIYSVGTQAIELPDPSRLMLRGQEIRRWRIQAFYPAKEQGGPYSYMPGTLKDGIIQGTHVLSWAQSDAVPLEQQKFPVIIFVPGRGALRQQYTILLEELASHGYVVLSMDQPYVANFVQFLDGGIIVLTFKDAWSVTRDRDYRYAYDDEVIAGALQDIFYLLDNLDKVEKIANLCNPEQTVVMGHSLGANIAHNFGFNDKRINAIIDIDSKITERKVFGHLGVPPNKLKTPILFIRGALQYQEDVGDQLTKVENATIWPPLVEHSAFSDNIYLAAKIDNFGKQRMIWNLYNWPFNIGPFWDSIDTSVGAQTIDNWISHYRQHIVQWLAVTLP